MQGGFEDARQTKCSSSNVSKKKHFSFRISQSAPPSIGFDGDVYDVIAEEIIGGNDVGRIPPAIPEPLRHVSLNVASERPHALPQVDRRVKVEVDREMRHGGAEPPLARLPLMLLEMIPQATRLLGVRPEMPHARPQEVHAVEVIAVDVVVAVGDEYPPVAFEQSPDRRIEKILTRRKSPIPSDEPGPQLPLDVSDEFQVDVQTVETDRKPVEVQDDHFTSADHEVPHVPHDRPQRFHLHGFVIDPEIPTGVGGRPLDARVTDPDVQRPVPVDQLIPHVLLLAVDPPGPDPVEDVPRPQQRISAGVVSSRNHQFHQTQVTDFVPAVEEEASKNREKRISVFRFSSEKK